MQRVFAALTLVAALLLAPVALYADTMNGQFAVNGIVQNVGTTLNFNPGSFLVQAGSQTGSFVTLVPNNAGFSSGPSSISYNPYIADSAVYLLANITITINSLTETTVGNTLDFSGVTTLSAPGFTNTPANLTFSTSPSGSSMFLATFVGPPVPSPVPEPSSLALFASGALALTGFAAKKFRGARA